MKWARLSVYSKCHSYLPPLADAGGCNFHYSPQYRSVGLSKQHAEDSAFIAASPVAELKIQFVLRAALQEESRDRWKQVVHHLWSAKSSWQTEMQNRKHVNSVRATFSRSTTNKVQWALVITACILARDSEADALIEQCLTLHPPVSTAVMVKRCKCHFQFVWKNVPVNHTSKVILYL